MAQFSEGKVFVSSGTQDVFAVWEATLSFPEGPFQDDDPLDFQSTGATGQTVSWDPNSSRLRFIVTSDLQPAAGEAVTSTGTLSGTLVQINSQGQFVGNIDPGDLFVPTTEDRVSYEVASVANRSKFLINAAFAQPSLRDSSYIVSNSFTPVHGLAYAEAGDQEAAEVIKRGLIKTDSIMISKSDLTTVSGHLQGEVDSGDSAIQSELVAASGSLQDQIDGKSDSGHTHSHSALSGLGADDHPQYLLADGTRPLAGDWSAGSHDITGIAALTAVTGTLSDGITAGSAAVTGTLTAEQGSFSDSLTVSGVPVFTAEAGAGATKPATTYVEKTGGDQTISATTDTEVSELKGIAVPGSPDGSKVYKVWLYIEGLGTTSSNDFFRVRVRMGQNGNINDADVFEALTHLPGTGSNHNFGFVSIPGVRVTPASGDKITITVEGGNQFDIRGGSNSSKIAFMEIQEVIEA